MRVAVFGLGNVLRRDDGFGPSAVLCLEAGWTFPPSVELRDLGTPGLDLPSYLVGFDALIALDALAGPGPAGTLRAVDLRAMEPVPGHPPLVTGHEGNLRGALAIADLRGGGPAEAWLVGAVAGDLDDGTGLSAPVQAALAPACERVLERLAAWGLRPAPRETAAGAAAWWERKGT